MAEKTVTVYKARTDKQGNVSEFQKIGDYIIPNSPDYFSISRDVAGTIVEEITKAGGLPEDTILVIKNANQAIAIPLSIGTGTISDISYNEESFAQAIVSNTGATAVGVLVGLVVSGPLGLLFGIIASGIANYSYDRLWEWSEKGGLIDLWDGIFGNKTDSPYAEKIRNSLREGTRRIDPLIIDLDGDGIELRDIKESNAMFDITGSGFANKVGWVSPDDGFLVWDRNGNGRVDDITEMFGNATQSGFQALSLYDTNRDGKIDAFDDVFKNLKVWQDRDGDGRTDEGELMTLDEAGIKAINLNTQKTNINQGGNEITEVGTVEHTDGTKTQAGNVNFELDRLYSYYNREVKLNPEIIGLPWVRGYGFMPDLPIAKFLRFRYNFAQRRL